MTPTNFPHIRAAGLDVEYMRLPSMIDSHNGSPVAFRDCPFVNAEKVEAYLARLWPRLEYLDDCQCSSILGTDQGGHRCSTCGKFIKQPGDLPKERNSRPNVGESPEVFAAADFAEFIVGTVAGALPIGGMVARKANALLIERSCTVYGTPDPSIWGANDESSTHTALLIAVTPIECKDTAEDLVRELLKAGAFVPTPLPHDWVERARKVLGEKREGGR